VEGQSRPWNAALRQNKSAKFPFSHYLAHEKLALESATAEGRINSKVVASITSEQSIPSSYGQHHPSTREMQPFFDALVLSFSIHFKTLPHQPSIEYQ